MSSGAVRYGSLDLLRGIAILGTLATNIWIFTNPEGFIGYLNGSTIATTPPVWRAVESVLQQFAQGKFLGLLTLMFGIGLELQRRSAVRAGAAWPGRYPWRAALLLIDGILHFVLVVEFDVLMGYAVTGIVVAYLLATTERAQRAWMIAAAAVHLVLITALTVVLAVAPVASGGSQLDPNPYADGTWIDLVVFRLQNLVVFRLEPVLIIALSIAMFLLGALLVRRGLLDPTGHRLRRRLMIIGCVAFVADMVIGLGGGIAGLVFTRYGTAPLVALGILALVVEFVERRPGRGFVGRRIQDVGRTALSSYVLQNLVASAICYGWGLGLAARLDPAARVPATIGIYVVVVVVVVTAAGIWLKRFSRGPVELAWLWSFERITRALDRRAAAPAPVS
ncbi:DUF418 domain-containing protein [Microbacterium sp. zg-Y818]|uniref:DUF418 domain-containing protein n=1 Tax=unclassified Microbacterium TaxID=2609290 RepID=UPI00214AAEB8|nr:MULTISPECIES: DUF418 domain-containing protein [unclassified Microbacterium]MCR2799478.1 DUF418 domain-containing protein [Microbacterium sp. zg.Y818]WIM21475.1 DUF418 domain-containing protein [Microbacterium sp. zg-Y818]